MASLAWLQPCDQQKLLTSAPFSFTHPLHSPTLNSCMSFLACALIFLFLRSSGSSSRLLFVGSDQVPHGEQRQRTFLFHSGGGNPDVLPFSTLQNFAVFSFLFPSCR